MFHSGVFMHAPIIKPVYFIHIGGAHKDIYIYRDFIQILER